MEARHVTQDKPGNGGAGGERTRVDTDGGPDLGEVPGVRAPGRVQVGGGVSLLRVTTFGIHDTLSKVLHAKSWCLQGRLLGAPDAEMGSPWDGAMASGEAAWKVWIEQLLFQAIHKPRDRTTAESDSGPSRPSSPSAEPERKPGPGRRISHSPL